MEGDAPSAAGWHVGPRLSPAGGVVIAGADLSAPLSPALKEAILRALRDHYIAVFPQQTLTREQQFLFAATFGEVEPPRAGKRHAVAHILSNLDAHGNPLAGSSPAANDHWHTDKPYHPLPPSLTTLYAVELPPAGGDTEFANTAMAYAALRVVFSPKFVTDPQRRTAVAHPLVRTHPDTGDKALYLGNHALGILGMPAVAGAALLGELLAHATQRRFVYTHRWHVGDLIVWDNRCLLHRAVANYDRARYRRVLHRSLVRGTAPF